MEIKHGGERQEKQIPLREKQVVEEKEEAERKGRNRKEKKR